MNTAGFRLRGVLVAAAAAALMLGNTAAARGSHGFAGHWHGPSGPSYDRGIPHFRHERSWWVPSAAFLTVLPDLYATYWFAGIPYYLVDGNYYVWQEDSGRYVATPPPSGTPEDSASATSPSVDPFVYPSKGQSESQRAADRSQCHDWAVEQSGNDPTQAPPAQKPVSAQARDAYARALTACLEGRGYSVK